MTAPSLWISRIGGPTVGFGLAGDSQGTRSSATGAGGWQVVDRPRRGVTTEWVDYGQYQLTMSLILDGFTGRSTGQRSCEPAIAEVESWELPVPGAQPPEPPKLKVRGPVPHNEMTWVVYTLTWKEAIRDPTTGVRWQQNLDLVLWQYLPPSVLLQAASPALAALASAATSAGAAAGTQSYTVKAGDTLLTIATSFYGSYNYWTLLANANNIRDPDSLTAGQVLTVPTKTASPPQLAVKAGLQNPPL